MSAGSVVRPRPAWFDLTARTGLMTPFAALALAAACGRAAAVSTMPADGAQPASRAVATVLDAGPPPASEDPALTDLWAHASEGDDDELARLAARVSSEGLTAATSAPERRVTALRALAFGDDFSALPALARIASSGSDEDAAIALDSAATLANAPRMATDPEEALEVQEGVASLLALAKDEKKPTVRRAKAVRVLRLLEGRGWLAGSEIPTALDAR